MPKTTIHVNRVIRSPQVLAAFIFCLSESF